ncbi:NAD(+) synthase [Paratissierella segnis]|jgi:NAD+ synthase|uniref:NH(3)-dependent NAD(+) synthetase n=1 Tax=Paratissierella segnis TaxID=2763679 RepID=A0A926IIJ8_9FIRM|nr:NAD(+) synthase [Paratissierella segnis]MBC8587039.1 NAD(+) synthase [Paratissierella segnis]
MENLDLTIKDLINWLKIKVKSANAKGLVFGLSGGIDSAVIAGLAKQAFPGNSLGVMMPCHSTKKDEEDALLIADKLNLKTTKVDLNQTYDIYLKSTGLDSNNDMAKANIKPRLRMTTLYYFAQHYNYLVAGSSNKSEFFVGYFTKFGDSGADLLPLADFVKSEIVELARALGIPDIIITKPPSAGLWEDQTDEEEMGFGYDVLDKYIRTGKGTSEITKKIDRMNQMSSHKREFPPIFMK